MDIWLNDVRLAFPALWVPRTNVDPQTNKTSQSYQATGIFPPDHPAVKIVSDAIRDVAKAKWADRAPEMLKSLKAGNRLCLRNGDAKSEYDGYAGNLFVAATGRVPGPAPLIMDRDGRTVLKAEDGRPYGGCYVNMLVNIWAQDNQFGKRINAGLKGVQFMRDGDAFGAGAPAKMEQFSSYEDDEGGGLAVGAGEEDGALV